MIRLSSRPECPGRAPPGVPVSGNRAVDTALSLGRGLRRVEGAVATCCHSDLFCVHEDIGFAGRMVEAGPVEVSRGHSAQGSPDDSKSSAGVVGGHTPPIKQECPGIGFQTTRPRPPDLLPDNVLILHLDDRYRTRIRSLPCAVGKVIGHLPLRRVAVDPVLFGDLAELIVGILFEDLRTDQPAGFTADTSGSVNGNLHHRSTPPLQSG